MHPRRRPALLLVCALLGAAACLGVSAGTANAVAANLVALGDSYASGVGTRSYDPDSGSCQRSPYAYPVLDADRVGASLSFVACSGATTSSVKAGQIGALSASTTHATVTVGGNDVGFTRVITACAQPWWSANCNGEIDQAQSDITGVLPGRLDALYAAIDARAPGASVVVVGYPRLFMGQDCNAGTWFSPAEQDRLNTTADMLADVTLDRAAAHGFAYVDPRDAFTGHAICDDPEWVNGLSQPVAESYHPNRAGQTAYADLVDDHLT